MCGSTNGARCLTLRQRPLNINTAEGNNSVELQLSSDNWKLFPQCPLCAGEMMQVKVNSPSEREVTNSSVYRVTIESLCRRSRRWAGERRWRWTRGSSFCGSLAAWRLPSSCSGSWLHPQEYCYRKPYWKLPGQMNTHVNISKDKKMRYFSSSFWWPLINIQIVI